MIQLESPLASRPGSEVQLAYKTQCSTINDTPDMFVTSIAPFPSAFELFEVVVLDTGHGGLGSGRGAHLDLARQTRKIRGSVIDPTQRSRSSRVLTVPFFVQKFCKSPVETQVKVLRTVTHYFTYDTILECPTLQYIYCDAVPSVQGTSQLPPPRGFYLGRYRL